MWTHADLFSDWETSILWTGSQGQIKQPVRVWHILLHCCSEFVVPFSIDDCTSNATTDCHHSSSNYFCNTGSRWQRTKMSTEYNFKIWFDILKINKIKLESVVLLLLVLFLYSTSTLPLPLIIMITVLKEILINHTNEITIIVRTAYLHRFIFVYFLCLYFINNHLNYKSIGNSCALPVLACTRSVSPVMLQVYTIPSKVLLEYRKHKKDK